MAHWVGAQGRVKLDKKRKTPPLLTSPPEKSKLESKKNFFFQSKLEDFPNP